MKKIRLIMGPMFAGKTSRIIDFINQKKGRKVLVINYFNDSREKQKGCVLSTHNMAILNSISSTLLLTTQIAVKNLFDIKSVSTFDLVVIDEAQFFPDLYSFVSFWKGKTEFVVAGLDTDYKKQPFGDIPKIKDIANEVIQLKGQCCSCPNLSTHTRRKNENSSLELIGGSDIYEPVCERCHPYTT